MMKSPVEAYTEAVKESETIDHKLRVSGLADTIEELLTDNFLQNGNVPDEVRVDEVAKNIMLEVGVVVSDLIEDELDDLSEIIIERRHKVACDVS